MSPIKLHAYDLEYYTDTNFDYYSRQQHNVSPDPAHICTCVYQMWAVTLLLSEIFSVLATHYM